MNLVNHNYEYREQFKKSLRSYERSATGKAQRPIFSAMNGRRNKVGSQAKEDQRLFGTNSDAYNKLRKERELRKSLQREVKVDNFLNSAQAEKSFDTGLKLNTLNVNTSAADLINSSSFDAKPQDVGQGVRSQKVITYPIGPRDFLVEGQSTFPFKFVKVQTELNYYQKRLDNRLAQPKHQRKRVVGRNYLQLRDEKIRGMLDNKGAFNNKTSWLPDKTSKLEGKRDYMIPKSNVANSNAVSRERKRFEQPRNSQS